MKIPQKILLTGGTGLLGTKLTEFFSAEGSIVLALNRTKPLDSTCAKWIKWDMLSGRLPDDFSFEGIDVIVHNAALILEGKSNEERRELQAVNVLFTEDLMKKAAGSGVNKVLFTSSLSFIRKPLPSIIIEDSPLAPKTPYASSKYSGEQIVRKYAEQSKMDYYIFRISSPVSDRLDLMPKTVVRKWIEQAISGAEINVYGSGERTQNFVSVSDVAEVYLNAIRNHFPCGLYNIASEDSISMHELASIISKKFGVSVNFSGEDQNEHDRWNVSIEKAKRVLNFNPKFTSKEVIVELLNSNL